MKPDMKPDRAILWKKARKPKIENDMANIEDDEVETEDDQDGNNLSKLIHLLYELE